MINHRTRDAIATLLTTTSTVTARIDAPVAAQPSWWAARLDTAGWETLAKLQGLHGGHYPLAEVTKTITGNRGNRDRLAVWLTELAGVGVLDVAFDDSTNTVTIATIAGELDEHQEYVHNDPVVIVPRWDGGTNVTVRISARDATHLQGIGLWQLADRMHSALVALARVRDDEDATRSPHDWAMLIRDIETLRDQVAAIQMAAIRAHEAAGGTMRGLAEVMEVSHSTVQRRREAAADLNRPYTSWTLTSHD